MAIYRVGTSRNEQNWVIQKLKWFLFFPYWESVSKHRQMYPVVHNGRPLWLSTNFQTKDEAEKWLSDPKNVDWLNANYWDKHKHPY